MLNIADKITMKDKHVQVSLKELRFMVQKKNRKLNFIDENRSNLVSFVLRLVAIAHRTVAWPNSEEIESIEISGCQ